MKFTQDWECEGWLMVSACVVGALALALFILAVVSGVMLTCDRIKHGWCVGKELGRVYVPARFVGKVWEPAHDDVAIVRADGSMCTTTMSPKE